MELYVLVQAASGEDMSHDAYSYTPEPTVLGAYEDINEAIKRMKEEVQQLVDDAEDEDIEVDEESEEYTVVTNTDADYCVVFRIQPIKIN